MENIITSNEEALADLRTNIISVKSTKNYNGAITNFIFWIYLNCQSEVCDDMRGILDPHKSAYEVSLAQVSSQDLIAEVRDSRISKLQTTYFRTQKKRIKTWFTQTSASRNRTPPVQLSSITGDIVTSYLLSLTKLNGDPPSYSHYGTHRASVKHLFRVYRAPVPDDFDEIMALDFKSLRRQVANRVNNEGDVVQVGKSPIEYSLYSFVARQFLEASTRESVFENSFFTLCWGLMARVGNIEAICLNHIEWENDSFVIYFAQGKTDQGGENAKYPRHLYANPTCPQICPVLNLPIYLLCFPIQDSQVKLFHGSSQYERFRKQLDKNLKLNCLAELDSRGLGVEQIGTHSIRKGAASFAASGTTASPSALAIHLRAGWSFSGV